jgi:hypothetical protein
VPLSQTWVGPATEKRISPKSRATPRGPRKKSLFAYLLLLLLIFRFERFELFYILLLNVKLYTRRLNNNTCTYCKLASLAFSIETWTGWPNFWLIYSARHRRMRTYASNFDLLYTHQTNQLVFYLDFSFRGL